MGCFTKACTTKQAKRNTTNFLWFVLAAARGVVNFASMKFSMEQYALLWYTLFSSIDKGAIAEVTLLNASPSALRYIAYLGYAEASLSTFVYVMSRFIPLWGQLRSTIEGERTAESGSTGGVKFAELTACEKSLYWFMFSFAILFPFVNGARGFVSVVGLFDKLIQLTEKVLWVAGISGLFAGIITISFYTLGLVKGLPGMVKFTQAARGRVPTTIRVNSQATPALSVDSNQFSPSSDPHKRDGAFCHDQDSDASKKLAASMHSTVTERTADSQSVASPPPGQQRHWPYSPGVAGYKTPPGQRIQHCQSCPDFRRPLLTDVSALEASVGLSPGGGEKGASVGSSSSSGSASVSLDDNKRSMFAHVEIFMLVALNGLYYRFFVSELPSKLPLTFSLPLSIVFQIVTVISSFVNSSGTFGKEYAGDVWKDLRTVSIKQVGGKSFRSRTVPKLVTFIGCSEAFTAWLCVFSMGLFTIINSSFKLKTPAQYGCVFFISHAVAAFAMRPYLAFSTKRFVHRIMDVRFSVWKHARTLCSAGSWDQFQQKMNSDDARSRPGGASVVSLISFDDRNNDRRQYGSTGSG